MNTCTLVPRAAACVSFSSFGALHHRSNNSPLPFSSCGRVTCVPCVPAEQMVERYEGSAAPRDDDHPDSGCVVFTAVWNKIAHK